MLKYWKIIFVTFYNTHVRGVIKMEDKEDKHVPNILCV